MSNLVGFDSITDYLASMNPQMMLDFFAPKEMQSRLEFLIRKEKKAPLNKDEKDELDHYLVLERIVRLAKANALLRLKGK